jgi:hypothetical protein
MKYRKCEKCGASLDWGEKCDCQKTELERIFGVQKKEEEFDINALPDFAKKFALLGVNK